MSTRGHAPGAGARRAGRAAAARRARAPRDRPARRCRRLSSALLVLALWQGYVALSGVRRGDRPVAGRGRRARWSATAACCSRAPGPRLPEIAARLRGRDRRRRRARDRGVELAPARARGLPLARRLADDPDPGARAGRRAVDRVRHPPAADRDRARQLLPDRRQHDRRAARDRPGAGRAAAHARAPGRREIFRIARLPERRCPTSSRGCASPPPSP